QEINALRTIYQLRLTQPQLQAVAKLASQTMAKDREYKKPKASEDYRSILGDLRKALLDADYEDERISELEEKVTALSESEQPEVDDVYEVTEAARKRVPEIYKLLKPYQLVLFYATQIEETLDPLDELVSALEGIREQKPEEWKANRDELADDIAWMTAGLEIVPAEKVAEQE